MNYCGKSEIFYLDILKNKGYVLQTMVIVSYGECIKCVCDFYSRKGLAWSQAMVSSNPVSDFYVWCRTYSILHGCTGMFNPRVQNMTFVVFEILLILLELL